MKNNLFICTLAATLAVGGLTTGKIFAAESTAAAPAGKSLLQRIADKLDLSEDQRSQIKSVLDDEKDVLAPLLSAAHDARKNLRAAIRAGDATEASVRAAAAKVGSAEADLAVERMKLYGKIAPILTDAQRQQFAELQQHADEAIDGSIARYGSGSSN